MQLQLQLQIFFFHSLSKIPCRMIDDSAIAATRAFSLARDKATQNTADTFHFGDVDMNRYYCGFDIINCILLLSVLHSHCRIV